MAEYTSARTGVFYPHIHFRSREWLRASVLYYDRLARIVPEGIRVDSRQRYEEFLDEDAAGPLVEDVLALKSNGFIVDESPAEHLADVAASFSTFLKESLSSPAQRKRLLPAFAGDTYFYSIHPEKMDPQLIEALRELGLIHTAFDDDYSDIELEGVTAAFYMLYLAKKMAGRRGLVTDSAVYQSLMYQPVSNGVALNRGRRDQELRLATAVFQTAIPTGLESVPIDTLLKVQYDLAGQRKRFQDKLAALAKSMESIENEEELQEQVDAQARKLKDEQDELVDKLRSAQLTFGTALFSVSAPAWVTSTWGLAATTMSPLVAGAVAVGISGLAIKSIFDQRAAKRTNAMTYVLNVRKRLKARGEAKRIVTLDLKDPDQPRPNRHRSHRVMGRRRFKRRMR